MCMLPQHRGGACFCTRGAMQDYYVFFYSRVGKNRDTSRGTPAGAGAGRGASHKTASLVTQLSRHGAAIAYTDLLSAGPLLLINSLLE